MFELSIALKYLIPRRKQLSVSLIALMAVGVISLVVWLVLVFLSVTEGIERSWMDKLTKLNAPVRINPTEAYYSSYYHQIDLLSSASHFRAKHIGEKAQSQVSDPYVPEEDGELPLHFPSPDLAQDGSLRDPVIQAYRILNHLQEKYAGMVFQDYEVGGALMRLQMLRSEPQGKRNQESQSFLTQVSYVSSFADISPYAASLTLPPRIKDLNHLFFLASHSVENTRADGPSLVTPAPKMTSAIRLKTLANYAQITQLKNKSEFWKIPTQLLPKQGSFQAQAHMRDGRLSHLTLSEKALSPNLGTLRIADGSLSFYPASGQAIPIPSNVPIIAEGEMIFDAQLVTDSLENAQKPCDLQFILSGSLQGKPLKGIASWEGLEIAQAEAQTEFHTHPPETLPWTTQLKTPQHFQAFLPINAEKETGVLLARNFQDNGVMIGDRGYLSYTTASAGSIQEQRLPIFVSGFYDPGVMSIGAKFILVPRHIAQTINASSSSFNLDKAQSNGIQVWFEELNHARHIKQEIEEAFAKAGIDSYWKVSTFHDYDFAKDLLQQFQSDKYLFTLVGAIILIVACCNIISLLVLLVNDKKRHIGILQAMGASSRSIAFIFGTCGAAMGIISSVIGTCAALYTMHHIDSLVNILSAIQGHDAFNAAFYGKSLPSHLSEHAVIFVLVATPLISLCAGLVPAIKACRLRPSAILRSE